MRACVEEARAYDEEGADSQSLDLRAQWVEEGLTEECEEEERLEEEEEGRDRHPGVPSLH